MTSNATAQSFTDRAELFSRILDSAGGRWDAPSPCDGWTVRDVVRHVLDTERDFLGRHDLLDSPAPSLADPAAAFRTHAADVVAVLGRDGTADRAYDGYLGPRTFGVTVAEFYGWDLGTHGWDVARATGQEWSISDEEAELLDAAADGWGHAPYSEGVA
jgi:uncharacterized protein (TIGR03086 family)